MASMRAAALILAATLWPALACAQGSPSAASGPPPLTPAAPDAKLYFISPANGARVRSPITVQFGLRNMGVTQAGNAAPNAGHHHLLIDARESLSLEDPIPADKAHVHFGGGQTETQLELEPGRHTLQLVMGDADHRPFKPNVMSEKIEVTILGPARNRKRR